MSEPQIQENPDQTTPDAVKAGVIEKFEEDQKESIKKAEETRKDLNPEEKKDEETTLQKIGKRAKFVEGVQKYGPIAAPLIGADVVAQTTEGIVGSELDPTAQKRVTQQRSIGSLSFEDFKNGVKDGSIQEYQGKMLLPQMADTEDDLLRWWTLNIGSKQTVTDDGKRGIAQTYLESANINAKGEYVPDKDLLETHDPFLFKIGNNSKERQLLFQTNLLKLVKGKIGGPTKIDPVGQNRIQQILVNTVSNTEFFPVLQERLKEVNRGSFLEIPALATEFGAGYFDELAERIREIQSASGAGFVDAWNMTKPFRDMKANQLRKSFAGFGLTQLSDVINKSIVEQLEIQRDNGEITPERFDQLTKVKLADNTEVPVQFLTESDAQGVLELSFESLSSPEQFLAVLGENAISMLSIGGVSQALVKKFGYKQIEEVKKAMKKDPQLARLGIAGAAYRLQGGKLAGQLNLGLIKRGLESKKQEAYQIRLSNTIEEKRNKLDELELAGKSTTAEYKILKNETTELITKRYVDKIKLSTLPIIRTTFKESFPLSIGQLYFGEAYQFFNPDMSQFEGEMWGTLTYIAGGGFAMKTIAGKVGRGVGNILYNPSASRSRIVSGLTKFLEKNETTSKLVEFIRSNQFIQTGKGLIIPNADLLKRYNQKLINERGFGLDKDEFKASRYVLELASVMDEKNLDRTLDTITRYTTMETKFINSFPEDMRNQAAELYRSNFAQASGIGALEAAGALATNKINLRDIKSFRNIDEMIDLDNLNMEQVQKNNFAIQAFKKMLQDKGVDITTNKAGVEMLNMLETANINFIKRLDEQMINTAKTLREMKAVYFKDPTRDIPESFHENVSALEEKLGERISKIKGMESEFFEIEDAATDVNTFFLERIKRLNNMADSDEAYINGSRLLVEEFVSHTMGAGRRYAARGFAAPEKLAKELNVKVDLTDTIFNMKNTRQELTNIPLRMLFSKEGIFFNSTMGRKAYVAFQKMARNGMNALSDEVRKDLDDMARTKGSDHFIDENATELDIALYWSDWFKKNGKADAPVKFQPFLATPKDMIYMQTAFVEYAYKIGDDALAKQYVEFGDSIANLLREKNEDVFNLYKKAKETYQNEYFDRIRKGFMGKLISSRDGPRTVAGKLKTADIAKLAREEGIELTQDSLKVLKGDASFKYAYKGSVNPLTAFEPLVNEIIKQAKAKNAVASVKLKESFRDLNFNFGGRVGGVPTFDLTTPKGKQDFELMKGMISTMVRANWATKATSELKKATSPRARIALRKQEGYDFTAYDNLDSLSSGLTLRVREVVTDKNDPNFGKTVVREKQAVDLTEILSQQKDIVGQMEKHEELRIEYKKLIDRFEDQKADILAQSKTDSKIEQFIFREVESLGTTIGGDPQKFYDTYVMNNNVYGLRKLKDKLYKELTEGKNLPQEELDLTRKKINEGIANILAQGALSRAGIRTGSGMVNKADVPDVFYDEVVEGDTFAKKINRINMFKTKKGIDGSNVPIQVLTTPQELVLDLKDPNKVEIFKEVMDEDHFEYFENMVEYMTMIEKGDFSKVKLEGLTRGISTNEAISRAFNLARGMVSPTYVAAEFAVRVAEMRGIQLLGLVAQDKEAARIITDLFKVGVKPSERDVGKLSELMINFVFKDLVRAGLEPPKYAPSNPVELEEMTNKLLEQYDAMKQKEEES